MADTTMTSATLMRGRAGAVLLGESAVAAGAASIAALLLEVPVWAMFAGWIVYFSRTPSLRQGGISLVCAIAGLGLGLLASIALGLLTPLVGPVALTMVVFVVAMTALASARLPLFDNLLAVFTGLVCWFAMHQPPGWPALATLIVALALGSCAGALAHALHRGVLPRHA